MNANYRAPIVTLVGREPTQRNEAGSTNTVQSQLVELASQLTTIMASFTDQPREQLLAAADLKAARQMWLRRALKVRRSREQFLPAALLGEPGWDMLLELALARIEDRVMSVKVLCIAGAVPTTTALRWIKHLLDSGMAVRHADAVDRRRHFIQISDRAFTSITDMIGRAS